MLTLAGAASSAERPGKLDWVPVDFSGRIGGLDTASDGRVVVAGDVTHAVGTSDPSATWVQAYLPSGALDQSFGTDGVVGFQGDDRTVVAAAIQPDGRVLVAESAFGSAQHLVRRLTWDGDPDATFGARGSIQPNHGRYLTDIALQPDGRLVVIGNTASFPNDHNGVFAARYLPDGSPDLGFGPGGVVEVGWADGGLGWGDGGARVALQPDGALILTARQDGVPVIARLLADGRPDTSLNGGGFSPMEVGRVAWADRVYRDDLIPPAVVLPDGRIRVGVAFRKGSERELRMALVGLSADGHPDLAFGSRGLALGPVPNVSGPRPSSNPATGESIMDLVADPRGGILAAGARWNGRDALAKLRSGTRRFRPDGSADRSFGDLGIARGALVGNQTALTVHAAFLGDDRLVLAEDIIHEKSGGGNSSLRALHAGYDEDPPMVSAVVAGCHVLRVRIRDLSPMDRVVVRAGAKVIERTNRKRSRVFVRGDGGRRLTVRATDLAGNSATRRVRLPPCQEASGR